MSLTNHRSPLVSSLYSKSITTDWGSLVKIISLSGCNLLSVRCAIGVTVSVWVGLSTPLWNWPTLSSPFALGIIALISRGVDQGVVSTTCHCCFISSILLGISINVGTSWYDGTSTPFVAL